MSVETLKADLTANMRDLASLTAMASPEEIVNHLKNSLWPFLEALTEELGEVDDCVADMIEGADDILQPETAEVFSAIIAGGIACAAALRARITRESDPALSKVVDEFEKNLKDGEAILREIVIDTGEPLGDEDDDAEEDDDDEQGDD